MAVTNTPRFLLPQWSEGTDAHPTREGWNTILDILEDKGAIAFPSGLIANRPPAGQFGRFYLATDQGDGRLYYDGGAGWVEITANGGGGAGRPLAINGAATEGTSNRSARADHTHALPLASRTAHGAMASQWVEAMESISVSAVASSLVKRTVSGNVVVPATPGGGNDATSQTYVLAQTEDIRTATHLIRPGDLVRRWPGSGSSNGTIHLPTPAAPQDGANKAYVDGKTWAGEDITSGVIPHARIWGSTHAYNTQWNGAASNPVRNVYVTSGGEFCFVSSTIRHKINIEPYGRTVEDLLAVEPVEFDRLDPKTGEPSGGHDHGVIVERAGKHVPELIVWGEDEDGQPRMDGWDYIGMSTGFQKLHRHHAERAAEQDRKIEELTNTVAELTAQVRALLGTGEE